MSSIQRTHLSGWWLFLPAILLTTLIYWGGLTGSYLFDDYPNIVDNKGVQPADANLPTLVRAALSSPSSEFKRPLASLSFGLNYLASGLNPYWMKLTNLIIHLINGLLTFCLVRLLLWSAADLDVPPTPKGSVKRINMVAAIISSGWLLLPINLTAVLYVVQRMESLANIFVLTGLIGYIAGRRQMLRSHLRTGLLISASSLIIPTGIGLLAKETAVMLPAYAFLIECAIFRFNQAPSWRRISNPQTAVADVGIKGAPRSLDVTILTLFAIVLVAPLALGLIWLLPGILRAESWASRDFTLTTRLLSELRVIVDYIFWTLLPRPEDLSFYHDDFVASTSLVRPWTTGICALALASVFAFALWARKQYPLVFLGFMLFFVCHTLTATILPLELIYEHRNYFASLGLLLALIPALIPTTATASSPAPFALIRQTVVACLVFWWASLTAMTAQAWGDPLRLAEELASRAPDSPRAQYELGRTYIIYSHYDPASPFTRLAYAPLERAASLPNSSILPQQALIFMNARMGLPIESSWWTSMIKKLSARKPGVQDESSLSALTQCARERHCDLPKDQMSEAFSAATSHGASSARLLSIYSDYAWNIAGDRTLAEGLIRKAIANQGREPAYLITLSRMLIAEGRNVEARQIVERLKQLNIGGQLNDSIADLNASLSER
jgi:hypothetical protein